MRTIIGLLLLASSTQIAVEAQQPPSPPDRFFDSHGVRIRYVEQGEGAPIVLIHGYTGTLDRHWIAPGVFGELAKDHRVIAFDCRGHGKSDKPADARAYGAEMGQDVVRLLDHLKIPRAHIIGYSMGAIIVGRLLATNPDRFITAALVAHPAVYRWTADDERDAEMSAREMEGPTPFRSLVVGLAAPNTPAPNDEEIRKLTQPLVAANDVKALAAYNRGRRGLTVSEIELASVRVPTLGIIGSDDPGATAMRELKNVMPGLKLLIVDGATHGGEKGVMRRPEFMTTLRAFLDERRDRGLASRESALSATALTR